MKHTIRLVLTLVFGLLLLTPVFAGNTADSLYNQLSRIVNHKLAARQLENDSLRKKGLPGNYVVYITDNDVAQYNGFPPNVLSLPQKNTKQSDVEKLWDFTSNGNLKRITQRLQEFSQSEDYDYYLVICAIYNMYRLDENTDFSDITWDKSDLLKANKGIATTGAVNKDEETGKSGYRNLFYHLIDKFKKDQTLQKSNKKAHLYHFVISMYEPFDNGTDSRPIGKLRHFQGIYWWNPDQNDAFDKVWTKFIDGHKGELAGTNSSGTKSYAKESWLEAFVIANQDMLTGIRKGTSEDLATIDDWRKLLAKLKEIPENVYAGFTASLRIRMVQLLSSKEDMPDEAEQKICALIEQAPVAQTDSVLKAMKDANPFVSATSYSSGNYNVPPSEGPNYQYGWCLLRCLTEKTNDAGAGFYGSDNYKRLIKAITILCYNSNGFKEKAKALNDAYLNAEDDKLPNRVIFYTYNSLWSKISGSFGGGRLRFDVKIDIETSYSGCDLEMGKEMSISYFLPNIPLLKTPLDPFEPIVFENNTDLGLLTEMNESPAQDHIVPAILLRYAYEKGNAQTISDATMAAIDAASMFTGYGELKAGITGIRKAWVVFDMVNSGINIVGNIAAYDNPKLKKVLEWYNLATGAVALVRMGGAAGKGFKNIYNALKAEKTAMNAATIREFVKSIKDGGDDLVELLPDDAQRIKDYLQRLKAEANARNLNNFELSVDDALATINAGGKIISDALANNKIFKQLTAMQDVVLENGLSLIHSKTKAKIAHWIKGGKTLFLDATENVGDDARLIDIIEGETFVPAGGGNTEVTDDLMIMQDADNTVHCVRGACFTAGTLVFTRTGIKPIEQVREMEEVQSWDEKAGQSTWDKVVKTFRRSAARLVKLVAGRDTLWSTPEHPYYTESGWKMASEIKPGWKLRLASGLFAAAISTTSLDTAVTVYNFEVASTHNYCIGSQGLVVHNSCSVLKKLTQQIAPELQAKFVKDFSGDANMLARFDKREFSLQAWEAMQSRGDLRRTPDILKKVTRVLDDTKMNGLGFTRENIDKIATSLFNDFKKYKDNVTPLDDAMFTTLDNFREFLKNNPETELSNFEKIISDLTNSGYPNRKGGHWIIQDIANDPKTFGGQRLEFNVNQKVNGSDFWVDVTVESGSPATRRTKFIEYKAGEFTIIKQDEFIREFVKRDLSNDKVVMLGQIEWRRDWQDPDLKGTIMKFLKSPDGRTELNKDKILNMFDVFRENSTSYKTPITTVDKLLKFMEENDDWFKLIFK